MHLQNRATSTAAPFHPLSNLVSGRWNEPDYYRQETAAQRGDGICSRVTQLISGRSVIHLDVGTRPSPTKSTLSPCFRPIPLTCDPTPIPFPPFSIPSSLFLLQICCLSIPHFLACPSPPPSAPSLSSGFQFLTLSVSPLANCLPCVLLWGSSGHRW